jgi:hypothetical protein
VAGNVETHHVATFSVAAPVDVRPPSTSSDATASYDGTATIRLTATPGDAAIARTCHRLDDGPIEEGTTVSVGTAGTHVLEFWSVDVAGNVETHHVATFVVVGTAVPRATSVGIAASARSARLGQSFVLSGKVTPSADAVGRVVRVEVRKPNRAYWSYSSARGVYSAGGTASWWWYRYTLVRSMVRGTYRFRATFGGEGGFSLSRSGEVAVAVR